MVEKNEKKRVSGGPIRNNEKLGQKLKEKKRERNQNGEEEDG